MRRLIALAALIVVLPVTDAGAQDRARLAYEHGGAIWTMAADGSDERRVTRGDEDSQPAVSPDGKRIAFVREAGANRAGLWLVDADGSGARRLLAPKGYWHSPAWSADGTTLVVGHVRIGRTSVTSRIATLSPDRPEPRTVTRLGPRAFLDSLTAPHFTPDERIGYTKWRLQRGGRFRPEIHHIGRDGTGDRVFLRDAAHGSWSPDGTQFAYGDVRDRNGEECGSDQCTPNAELAIVNADGTGRRVLLRTTADESDPVWSRDGTRLAFSSARNMPEAAFRTTEVHTIAPDGSCLTWLTNGTPGSGSPSWMGSGTAGAGGCGERGLTPAVEVKPGTTNRRPLWLGPTFENGLLSDAEHDMVAYEDCGAFDPAACPPAFLLTQFDACRGAQDPFAMAALRRGHAVGDVLVGPVLPERNITLVAGRTVLSVQINSEATPAQQAALAARIATGLRRVDGKPMGGTRLLERHRRRLPAALRAQTTRCR